MAVNKRLNDRPRKLKCGALIELCTEGEKKLQKAPVVLADAALGMPSIPLETQQSGIARCCWRMDSISPGDPPTPICTRALRRSKLKSERKLLSP